MGGRVFMRSSKTLTTWVENMSNPKLRNAALFPEQSVAIGADHVRFARAAR